MSTYAIQDSKHESDDIASKEMIGSHYSEGIIVTPQLHIFRLHSNHKELIQGIQLSFWKNEF